ncbi:hypothetical protein DRN74_04360 [Candidatus Micrarchaeota archaeon]|nr:MAG: hypothetical protein DRN74_04360 [Candidatus Micrarchaeota archaeon]
MKYFALICFLLVVLPSAYPIYAGNIGYAKMLYSVEGDMKDATMYLHVPFDSEYQKVEQITALSTYEDEIGRYAKLTGNFKFEAIIDVNTSAAEINSNPLMPLNLPSMKEYLKSSGKITPNNTQIRALAKEISHGLPRELDVIKAVVDWVRQNIEYYYDENRTITVLTAQQLLQTKKGVCGDFSVLTASLLRSLGIPTKYIEGWQYTGESFQLHAWLEAYVPGTGWVSVDPTNGEIGLLDAGHIKVMEGVDPSEMANKIRYVGTLPDYKIKRNVTLLTYKPFYSLFDTQLSISPRIAGPSELVRANLEIKNLKDTYMIASLNIVTTKGLRLLDDFKTVILPPRSKKNVSFAFYVPDDLEEGYSYTYFVKIYGPNVSVTEAMQAEASKESKPISNIEVNTLYKYLRNNSISIAFLLHNVGTVAIENIEASLSCGAFKQKKSIALLPGEKKSIDFSIPVVANKSSYIFTLELTYEGKRQMQSIYFEIPSNEGEQENSEGIPVFKVIITVLIAVLIFVFILLIVPYISKGKKPFASRISLHKIIKKKK